MNPRVRRFLLLLLVAAVTVGADCRGEPVCEDGILETSLVMQDDEYSVAAGLDAQLPVGVIGNAGVERCREIHGSVTFLGGISSFEDFDALEYVGGDIAFLEVGYPTRELDGRDREVIEGFGSLVRVDGSVIGGLILGMNALESVGGDVDGPSDGFFSLREVGGHLHGAGALNSLSHLANLEIVGGSLGTSAGDIDSLESLRYVGGNLSVSFADEVRFTPPVLEEIGWDLTVSNNDSLAGVAVPSMARVGHRVTISGNRGWNPGITEMARAAFEDVDIGAARLICRNGIDDPCPYDDECWDFYDDAYCCPLEMGTVECIEFLDERGG